MHISNQLIALSILTTFSFAIPMDKDPAHHNIIVQRVTAVDKPVNAKFLRKKNDLVVHGKDGIYQVDWKNNRVITQMMNGNGLGGLHLNQQRNLVVAESPHCLENICTECGHNKSEESTLEVVWHYDTEKKEKSCALPLIRNQDKILYSIASVFTASNKLYVFDQQRTVYCNDGRKYTLDKEYHADSLVADTKEEKITFTDYRGSSGQYRQQYTLTFDEDTVAAHSGEYTIQVKTGTDYIKETIAPKKLLSPIRLERISAPSYDYSKSCNCNQSKSYLTLDNLLAWVSHPTKKELLATISHDCYIAIYDLIQNKLISKTHNPLRVIKQNQPKEIFLTGKHAVSIDFSEDGDSLAVVVGDHRLFVLSNLYPKK